MKRGGFPTSKILWIAALALSAQACAPDQADEPTKPAGPATKRSEDRPAPATETPRPAKPEPPVRSAKRRSSAIVRERKRRPPETKASGRLLPAAWIQSSRVSLIVDLDPEGKRAPAYIAAEALILETLREPDEKIIKRLATYLAADRLSPKVTALRAGGAPAPSEESTRSQLLEIRRLESTEVALGFAVLVSEAFKKGLSEPAIHALLKRAVPKLYAEVERAGKVERDWIEKTLAEQAR